MTAPPQPPPSLGGVLLYRVSVTGLLGTCYMEDPAATALGLGDGTPSFVAYPLAAAAAVEARVAALEAERVDLFDRYMDAVGQGVIASDGKVCHGFMSTYEEAWDYLGLTKPWVTPEQFAAAVQAKRAALRGAAPASPEAKGGSGA